MDPQPAGALPQDGAAVTSAAFRKLQAEWDRRLAADGVFQDLESANRDGPLSNRGKIHAKYEDGGPALVERLAHGAEYVRWCEQVLAQLPATGRGQQRHRIWRLHAEGHGLQTIADRLGLNYHVVRAMVLKIEEKYRCEKKPPQARRERLATMRRTVRQIPTETLIQLVAAMVTATRTCSPSRCAA